MSSTVTYSPGIHCVIDINTSNRQVSATKRVKCLDGREYRTCDLHGDVVERSLSIFDALREVRHHNALRGGAA